MILIGLRHAAGRGTSAKGVGAEAIKGKKDHITRVLARIMI